MIRAHILLIALLATSLAALGQRAEGIWHGPGGSQRYSLYLPEEGAAGMMLAFHPLHSGRWNSASWRDHLSAFARQNRLLLICPDGGPDGRTGDPADLYLAEWLLDSLRGRMIRPLPLYVLGASWSVRAALKFSLRERPQACFLASSSLYGIDEFADRAPLLRGLKCFLIHGKLDALDTRFFPLRDALFRAGLCVDHLLVDQAGHEVEETTSAQVLQRAFNQLRGLPCPGAGRAEAPAEIIAVARYSEDILIYPDGQAGSLSAWLECRPGAPDIRQLRILNEEGFLVKTLFRPSSGTRISFPARGGYLLMVETEQGVRSQKLWIP